MATYIKKALKTQESLADETHRAVMERMDKVKANGEQEILDHYRKKYGESWDGKLLLSQEEIKERIKDVPQQVFDDLQFAYDQVYSFALKQKESLTDLEHEPYPGVQLGQRVIPAECAGCYIPGGRFSHGASAVMSIATAKAAGVKNIVACTPSKDGVTVDPVILSAISICQPDAFMILGGAHAIAALAYGCFMDKPADVIVGPGNRYVTEAKRILQGQVGIDVIAGPTESLVIADKTADPFIVAVDLVSQAEHGEDSPVWLVTDSKDLAETVLEEIPKLIAELPDTQTAAIAWRDFGEIVLCADREEMAKVNDEYAAEHVQVMAEDLDWWLKTLKNYGSLFLGEASTVPHGDKTSGTNHILPTNKAARYSGGLSVHKFLKVVTYQRLTPEANKKIGAVTSRISRLEGMEGHARAADVRLRKYFPNETFDFEVYDHKK